MRVVVTDAEYKLTLGAIRSLGRRRVDVVAVAAHPRALGFASRYVGERLVGPPPADEDAFVEFVAGVARGADAVLPIGQDSTRALARRAGDVPAPMPLAPWDAVEVADSKQRTLELAHELGLDVPGPARTFPAVAKSPRGSGAVRYVRTPDEVPPGWLLQEYVPGEGRGFFALLDHGEERAIFMHRRIREYPVTGGASTAAESVEDPELHDRGLRLLKRLRWHGVAMVEFKRDARDGSYRLMEINPKFWGSLDLAIAAGVDFPWLAVQLALGRSFDPVLSYRVGLRYQWVWSDLLHVAARPRDAGGFVLDLVRAEHDLTWRDAKPSAFEGLLVAFDAARRIRRGTLRYPHGRPAND